MDRQGCVILFAKAPVPGRVKTRLAARYGNHGAAVRYRGLARQTVDHVRMAWSGPMQLWCAPDRRHPWFRQLARRAGMTLCVQHPGDLGRRMGRAMAESLNHHPWALIIGADCAGVEPVLLRQAIAALQEGTELVIGPAPDGGYVFIGMNRLQPELFRAMPWGTADVMQETRARWRHRGRSVLELPGGRDVDTPTDFSRLRQRARGGHWLGLTRR